MSVDRLPVDRPTPPGRDSLLFADDDPVAPGHPEGPTFGDLRWDLSVLGRAANQPAGDAVLNFGRFLDPVPLGPSEQASLSPVWLLRAKEVVAVRVAPTRRTGRGRLDVYRVRESSSSTLKATLAHIFALATWARSEALPPDLDRWDQDDLDDFFAHLGSERPNPRTGAQGIDASSIRGYVSTLRTLHHLRDVLTDGGFSFDPWDGMSADRVTGTDVSVRRTQPIPAEQYQPLMRNLWKVIDQVVPDLLAARRRMDELNCASRVPWWGRATEEDDDVIAGSRVVLAHANVAPTLGAFRRVLTENPDLVLDGGTDLERRFGIPCEWFSRNHDALVRAGILERVHPVPAAPARCSVPGCGREQLRLTWCLAHEGRWRRAGRPDPTTWEATQQARSPLGPPPPSCAVTSCPREAQNGRLCGAHAQRWRAAGRPDIEAWATTEEAAVPSGGWSYRFTGHFPEVRTVADHVAAWLEDPEHHIPVRATSRLAEHLKGRNGGFWRGGAANIPVMAKMLGVGVGTFRDPKVRTMVEKAVERGQVVVGGLCEITAVGWADVGERPWIDGIDPAVLGPLTHFCRMCAVVFVYMFSGMRDSEVQSLKRGCVEEFWGHLTLTGKEFKTFRGGQARWVVIEPVAHAARIAEALTWHPERIVVTGRAGTDPVIDAGAEIDGLIATMNAAADLGLLERIPDGAPIRPHRFRRTFAITARKYPWMQIALHWQFKHASHFMTQSYYALNDDVTAEDNEVAMELVEAAVDRLADLYQRHEQGEPLYGGAARRLVGELDAISADVATAEPAGFGGQTWRHAEVRKRLRGSAFRLYPGVALDCAFGPGGACGGVEAPNWNACAPRCGNAVLDPTQLAFLKEATGRIRSYLEDGRIGTTSRLLLEGQLAELRAAIADHQSTVVAGTRRGGP